jgi:hypothetical protein
MKNKIVILKIVLAALLFACLLDMPYGYFQLVRTAAMIGFGILAFDANSKNRNTEMIFFIGLILLFQPLYKIALGRQLWNIVDVIVGTYLLVSIFFRISPVKGKK